MRMIAIAAFLALMIIPCVANAASTAELANTSLSGEGQEASQKFALAEGLSIFAMKHSGPGYFGVWLLDQSGNQVELLANLVGGFDGAKAVGISKPGDYLLDINADGPWTVDISQPRPQNAQSAPISFSGMGQQVSQFFTLKSGLTRFEMVHDGTGYFGVWLTDSKGNNVDLLVNEVGTFDGSKATGIARDGIYCLDISADGNWKIDVSQ